MPEARREAVVVGDAEDDAVRPGRGDWVWERSRACVYMFVVPAREQSNWIARVGSFMGSLSTLKSIALLALKLGSSWAVELRPRSS